MCDQELTLLERIEQGVTTARDREVLQRRLESIQGEAGYINQVTRDMHEYLRERDIRTARSRVKELLTANTRLYKLCSAILEIG